MAIAWLSVLLRTRSRILYAPVSNVEPICCLCGNARKRYSTDTTSDLEIVRTLKRIAELRTGKRHPYKIVNSLTEEDLLERFRNLEKLGVVNCNTVESLPLLSQHMFTVTNRVQVLRESGFLREAITAKRLAKFIKLSKERISTLKQQGIIPEYVDVMSHILQHVDLDPQHYPEGMLDQYATLATIRQEIVRAFVKKRFNMTDEEVKAKKANINSLAYKSFATINRNIRLIENEVGMPADTLKRHLYLLRVNPSNIEALLHDVDSIGGMDIQTALNSRPKIMCNSYGNLTKILKLLEEYNLPLHFNQAALKLFTLNHKTVRSRFSELDDIEYFSVYKEHPRLAILVISQKVAKKRLKLLDDANIQMKSLSLITDRRHFHKCVTEGYHVLGVQDLRHYLSNRYGSRFKELKDKLDRHPYWKYVPLVTVGRNQRFLSKHLSNDDILRCPIVLFYPDDRVQEEFSRLNAREGIDCCKENGQVKPEFVAPLIAYFIEKETNFSFDGFWQHDGSTSEPVDAPHTTISLGNL
ncbi:Hypothetical protein NTJ_01925 [Nesidiocoris tenuis]|uniref:Transcription termination factor 5, mitochondrial n=1 Tax=Nesidiocoris tenuis TaxID=355587 RepID=A0ABN7AAS3_9HEMI|nr:Hypothetical protein NTJ_01925 [Nesidiocoris tenuis]